MERIIQEAQDKVEIHKSFLDALHQEKIHTQQERTDYVKAKLIFVSALFGLGSVKMGELTNASLLYFIPFIAIGYDLYIHAADKSIKKIGAFMRDEPEAESSNGEKKWEQISSICRDRSARITNTLFSALVTIASSIYLYKIEKIEFNRGSIFYFSWIACCLVFIVLQGVYQLQRIKEIDNGEHIINSTKKKTLMDIMKRFI